MCIRLFIQGKIISGSNPNDTFPQTHAIFVLDQVNLNPLLNHITICCIHNVDILKCVSDKFIIISTALDFKCIYKKIPCNL